MKIAEKCDFEIKSMITPTGWKDASGKLDQTGIQIATEQML